uniref:Uncharacterized protein n=1 Tax=Anguilla anguilla TaxID=7936 RepID=A0A0E9QXL3_ANGAN
MSCSVGVGIQNCVFESPPYTGSTTSTYYFIFIFGRMVTSPTDRNVHKNTSLMHST